MLKLYHRHTPAHVSLAPRRPTVFRTLNNLTLMSLPVTKGAGSLYIKLCRKLVGCFGRSPTHLPSIDKKILRQIQHPLHLDHQRGTQLSGNFYIMATALTARNDPSAVQP